MIFAKLARGTAWCLIGTLLQAADAPPASAPAKAADEHGVLTAVYARTAPGYKRKKGKDGQWVREYYALTNGGPADGTVQDNAQAKIKFVAIATVLAEHLARQGYFPATDKDQVDLLLVVNWGRTIPAGDQVSPDNARNVLTDLNRNNAAQAAVGPTEVDDGLSMSPSPQKQVAQASANTLVSSLLAQDMLNRSREQSNAKIAHLLGYMGEINEADGIQRFAGGGRLYEELVADIEEPRYYVILSAFDFEKTVRQNTPKIRWVTRMSMRAPGNSFAAQAGAMIAYSSARFGQNTQGLERKLYPEYKVNLEDMRFLGMTTQPASTPAEATGK